MMDFGLTTFFQGAIGTVFTLATATKVVGGDSLQPFLLATGFSRTTSERASRIVPVLEGSVGASMLLGLALPSVAAAAAMAICFCAVLLLARFGGVTRSCRCFGALDQGQLSSLPILRAAGLAVGTLILVSAHLTNGPMLGAKIRVPKQAPNSRRRVCGT